MKNHTIRQGLDIPLSGAPNTVVADSPSPATVALRTADIIGLKFKLSVNEGESVRQGQLLCRARQYPDIVFRAPAGGRIRTIRRGNRRAIEEIVIEPDNAAGSEEFRVFSDADLADVPVDELRAVLLDSGLWPLIMQRPFGKIARPDSNPVAVFINAVATAPLAAQPDVLLMGRETDLAFGVRALSRFSSGKTYVSVHGNRPPVPGVSALKDVDSHTFYGPHPSGCTGVHIRVIQPLKRGETAWSVRAVDAADIGLFLRTGRFPAERIIALAGSEVEAPRYYRTRSGASLRSIIEGRIVKDRPVRMINGDVLTGTRTDIDAHLGLHQSMITVIPEGTARDFMGWGMPGFKRYSAFRTFASALMPKRPVVLDTRLHGGVRPIVNIGQWEKVFPFDIYLSHLIRAIQAGDIQEAESLGLLELAEEDVALCAFVDPSKMEVTDIIRRGLDLYEADNL